MTFSKVFLKGDYEKFRFFVIAFFIGTDIRLRSYYIALQSSFLIKITLDFNLFGLISRFALGLL